jgi:hypothetical protein
MLKLIQRRGDAIVLKLQLFCYLSKTELFTLLYAYEMSKLYCGIFPIEDNL